MLLVRSDQVPRRQVPTSLLNAMMTDFRAGKSEVYRKDVRNDQALRNALASDPAFALAYAADPAFHQAVEAVKYQGSVDPVRFDRNRASVMNTGRGVPSDCAIL